MNGLSYISGWLLTILLGDQYPVPLAYLDPGTGAMIISAIVGIFATVVLAVKTYWYKMVSFLKGKKNQSPQTPKDVRENVRKNLWEDIRKKI